VSPKGKLPPRHKAHRAEHDGYGPFQKFCDSEEARLLEKAGLLGSTRAAMLLERAILHRKPDDARPTDPSRHSWDPPGTRIIIEVDQQVNHGVTVM